MLHRVNSEPVNIGLADPIAVCLDQRVDDRRADVVVVVGVVLQPVRIAVLVLGIRIVIGHFPASVIPVAVAEFDWHRAIATPEIPEVEAGVVGIK